MPRHLVVRMMAFNSLSALLHILGDPSCVAAVGHGWVVVEILYLLQIYMHLVCQKKHNRRHSTEENNQISLVKCQHINRHLENPHGDVRIALSANPS